MMPAKPEATAVTAPTATVEHRASTRRVLKSHSKGELIKLVERLDRRAQQDHEDFRAAIDFAEDVATTLDLVRQALGVPPEPHQGMPERILEAAEKIKGERDQLAAPSRDLVAHMHRQMAFSREAFGPGSRHQGVIDHIRKELREIEASPEDLEEWIDVVLLALDGAWRAGHSPEQVAAGLDAKLTKNEQRKWPDWRTADRTKAIEHDRTGEGREGCTACNSQPGQYHAPECPAVDAFTAGRIPAGGEE